MCNFVIFLPRLQHSTWIYKRSQALCAHMRPLGNSMKRSYGLIHFGHENIIYFIFYMVEVETEALKAYVFLCT